MISKDELLMGRDKTCASEYTPEISENLDRLLICMNKVREAYAKPMTVNSGWRPPSVNGNVRGAAGHSKHMLGLACDIKDDGDLRDWVLANLELMKELGLYFEDFRWTPGWVHFQCVPPASGHRVFVPYANLSAHPMTDKNAWSGVYDESFNRAA